MTFIRKNMHIIAVILPLLIGLLMNSSMLMLNIFANLIGLLSLLFIIYWIWVGKLYAKLSYNKVISFIIGNLLWLVSFAVFLWQFVLLDDDERNIFLAGMSQHYGLFTVQTAARIVMLFEKNTIDGTQVMLISYILMLILFSIGFLYGIIRSRRSA